MTEVPVCESLRCVFFLLSSFFSGQRCLRSFPDHLGLGQLCFFLYDNGKINESDY